MRLWEEGSFRVLLEYNVLQPAIDLRYQMEPELEVECEANVPMPTYFYKYCIKLVLDYDYCTACKYCNLRCNCNY